MPRDAIDSWISKAKKTEAKSPEDKGVLVITCSDAKNKGRTIMEVAEKIWPLIMRMFDGVRDENGMLVQPARARGIALNVAQGIVNNQKLEKESA